MDDAELERLLADPSIYPRGGGVPELIRTHASFVVLVGGEAFKVKRAVAYAFLDFSTPEARLAACREEMRLNRRLAPGMYRSLVVLAPGPGGKVAFRDLAEDAPPPGDAVAVGVRMRRLTRPEMLDARLERAEVDHPLLGRLARTLATFHRGAERGPEVDRAAHPSRLRRFAEDNLAALEGRTSGPDRLATTAVALHLARATAGFFARSGALLEQRIAEGRAIDGHGDLHAGNVWISDDEILIYDALEFDADLRRGDAALDLAFLVMDLDRGGHRAAGAWLVREYAGLADDASIGEVLGGFKTYRALVRAKVAGLRLERAGGAERAALREEGVAFVALAISYSLPPSIVLMRGLPASGKSFLARRIAGAIGAAWHRSDVKRREVEARAGATAEERYGEAAKGRTYEALLADARADIEAGRSVVVDASFLDADRRGPFLALARELGAPLVVVEPQVTRETAQRRILARRTDPTEPSEADWDVFLALERRWKEPTDLPPGSRVVLAEDCSWPDACLEVLDALVRRASGIVP